MEHHEFIGETIPVLDVDHFLVHERLEQRGNKGPARAGSSRREQDQEKEVFSRTLQQTLNWL